MIEVRSTEWSGVLGAAFAVLLALCMETAAWADSSAGNTAVGTTNYPNGALQALAPLSVYGDNVDFTLTDFDHGYAYAVSTGAIASVIKISLEDGSNAPVRLSRTDLPFTVASGVIDTVHGYAYFGGDGSVSPARIIKVALGEGDSRPSVVGTLSLDGVTTALRTAAIDVENHYAYFATHSSPGRVLKIALGAGDALPSLVGSATFASGEAFPYSAAIDPLHGYAYFGLNSVPGRVVKVALGGGTNPPARVAGLSLSDHAALARAAIDVDHGYVYFVSFNSPAKMAKVALGTGDDAPSLTASLTLNESSVASVAIDTSAGYAYLSSGFFDGTLAKVALGSGDAAPTRESELFSSGLIFANSIALNPGNSQLLMTASRSVLKIDRGAGNTAPTEISRCNLKSESQESAFFFCDSDAGYGYNVATFPASVSKFRLERNGEDPEFLGTTAMPAGVSNASTAVVDTANGYAYLGTDSYPGKVVKIRLGTGDALPEWVGTLTLNSGEDNISSSAIDVANGYAYFCTSTAPGKIIKVTLGAGDNAPTRAGALNLDSGENYAYAVAADPASGYAWIGLGTYPAKVVKVALGPGADVPARVGALSFDTGEDSIRTAAIDTDRGYVYFGTYTSPGKILVASLGTGSDLPVRIGAATLDSGEDYPKALAIDAEGGFLYAGTGNNEKLVKLSLGAGASAPSRVSALLIRSFTNTAGLFLDDYDGSAYMGNTSERVINRVSISQKGFVKGTKFTLSEGAVPSAVNFYAHSATGNVRLALYTSAADPALLWQSGEVPLSAANDWLSVPISSGTPGSLALPAGDYWLAWQVDSGANVPSHAQGTTGQGFYLREDYGAFPAALSASTDTAPVLSDEVWSSYLSYAADTTGPQALSLTPSTAGPVNTTSITFTVVFNEPVVNFNDENDFIITHNGTAHGSVVISGSGDTYSVAVTDISGNGTFSAVVNTASDVQDLVGNPLVSSATSDTVQIDSVPPTVSIGTPTGSPLNSAGTAQFPVTVTGANSIALNSGDVTINHSGTNGGTVSVSNGTTASPTVEVTGVTGDGSYTISIAANIAADSASNTSAGAGPSDSVTVDNTAPSLSIGAPSSSLAKSTDTVSFPLTIDGADTVSLSDFQVTINHSGTADGTVNIVDGLTSTPTVQVSGVTGDGTYTITIAGGIASDTAGNASAETGESDAVTVDNTGPSVSQIVPGVSGPTNAGSVQFNVVFDGPVVNFDASDLEVTHSGTAHSGVTLTGSVPYIATVTGITGNGSFTLKVNPLSDVQDSVGNGLAAGVTSDPVIVDTAAPSVSIGTPTGSPVNSAGSASFPVSITGADSIDLQSGDIALNHSGTSGGSVNILNGTTATPAVQISGVAGNGSFTISIAAGIASDTAGNTSSAAGPSASVTVDNTVPSFSSLSVSPEEASPGEDVTISFFPDEPLSADPEVTVNGNPAARTAKATGYSYTYTVQPTDPDGPATIVVSGIDNAGNTATLTSTLLLTVLGGASVPLAAWPALLALGGAAAWTLRRKRDRK